jgi:heme exporter protein C
MATLQTEQSKQSAETNANVAARNPIPGTPGPLHGAWWKIGTGLLMSYVIYGAFFIAKGVCYFVGMVYAVLYLTRQRTLETDAKSATSMELGFLFCVLATVTGSIFAGVQWGSFWNWDPRETSIVIMLLLYASYLVLRGALAGQPEKRATLCAVYAIIALIPAQYLIWVVPRLPGLGSLHPPDTLVNPDKTSWTYKGVLYPAFLAFTMLFIWLFQLRMRLFNILARRQRQREL